MNCHTKLRTGQSRVIFTIPRLTLSVGIGCEVVNSEFQPFPVSALISFEPYIRGDDEEPTQEEYLEFESIYLLQPLYLNSNLGVSVHVNTDCNLLNVIDEKQYEEFILHLKRQAAQGLL